MDEIELGQAAEALFTNAAFVNALTATKARVFQEFCETKWFQARKRTELWRQIQTASRFEDELRLMIRDYNLALAQREHEKRLKSIK